MKLWFDVRKESKKRGSQTQLRGSERERERERERGGRLEAQLGHP